MKFVVLTGGIGCGKSTVGRMLAGRGAQIIDVDVLSRELQQPWQPLFEQMVARWGTGILDADGFLDRAALGRIVFADKEQLMEVTTMAAPLTTAELVRRANLHAADPHAVVLLEAAQLTIKAYGTEGLIMVDAPVEIALERLVRDRGMTVDDARARINSQVPRDRRLEHADVVIDNSGDLDHLSPQIETAWHWIGTLPDATPHV